MTSKLFRPFFGKPRWVEFSVASIEVLAVEARLLLLPQTDANFIEDIISEYIHQLLKLYEINENVHSFTRKRIAPLGVAIANDICLCVEKFAPER